MPVQLNSKLPPENAEARIEIIPLIDIMFFLLASFMLVSLSMVNLKSVKVNLPTAASAAADARKDYLDISVDQSGGVFVDKKPVAAHELIAAVAAAKRTNPEVRVFISGDERVHYGLVVSVLDGVRRAGVDRIALEIRTGGKEPAP